MLGGCIESRMLQNGRATSRSHRFMTLGVAQVANEAVLQHHRLRSRHNGGFNADAAPVPEARRAASSRPIQSIFAMTLPPARQVAAMPRNRTAKPQAGKVSAQGGHRFPWE